MRGSRALGRVPLIGTVGREQIMNVPRSMIKVMWVASGVAVLAGGVAPARGQCTVSEIQNLTASDGAPGDEFGGFRIAICGDTAVIGAYYSDDNGAESGSAYVFRFYDSSWHEEVKLLPDDGAAANQFGSCVGCFDDTAVVGAFGDDDACPNDPLFCNSGSAYVFRRYDGSYACATGTECAECEGADPPPCTGGVCEGACWIEEAKLLASEPYQHAHFGRECPMSGDTIAIGAHDDDENGHGSGTVYIFEKPVSGWVDMTETQKLLAADGALHDNFGVSVAMSGDTLVIGAHYNDDACPEDPFCDSGSAYVFERDDNDTPSDPTDDFWVEVAKLLASDGASGDEFGLGVAISGNTAVVGAHAHNESAGSAYMFERPLTGWVDMTETQELLPTDAPVGATFGSCVAIFGDAAVIGANYADDNGPDSGSAYLFRRDDNDTPSDPTDDFWAESAKLLSSDGAPGDNFGWPVAVSGDTAVIGAFLDDNVNGIDSGAAYVFDLTDTDGDGVIDACEADCNENGLHDENEPTRSRTFCVKCDSPSPPNDCSDGTQWSFLLDWLGDGRPNFEELYCGPVTPTSGTTAVDMAAGLAECINATVCSSITAAQFGSGKCLKVTVPGDVTPKICVGTPGDPPDDCQPPWVFNPTLIEVFLSGNDCNDNGEDDAVDIAMGTSPDANGDGIPDECGACCHAGGCDQVIEATCNTFGKYQGNETICEEECPAGIPTVTGWGLVIMTLLVVAAGSIVIARRRTVTAS